MENNENNTVNQPEDHLIETNEGKAEAENTVYAKQDSENIEPTDLVAKNAELNDRYLRLYSEFDNYRKRTAKEKSDIIRSAGEDVFKAIIPTIDDFERAIKANENVNEATPIKEGMMLIYNKLKATCLSKGLEPMDAVGKVFDADLMEAITHIPSPSEDMKGKVIDDVEKGYKLGDKVIRFAKVVVGN